MTLYKPPLSSITSKLARLPLLNTAQILLCTIPLGIRRHPRLPEATTAGKLALRRSQRRNPWPCFMMISMCCIFFGNDDCDTVVHLMPLKCVAFIFPNQYNYSRWIHLWSPWRSFSSSLSVQWFLFVSRLISFSSLAYYEHFASWTTDHSILLWDFLLACSSYGSWRHWNFHMVDSWEINSKHRLRIAQTSGNLCKGYKYGHLISNVLGCSIINITNAH